MSPSASSNSFTRDRRSAKVLRRTLHGVNMRIGSAAIQTENAIIPGSGKVSGPRLRKPKEIGPESATETRRLLTTLNLSSFTKARAYIATPKANVKTGQPPPTLYKTIRLAQERLRPMCLTKPLDVTDAIRFRIRAKIAAT